jgi:hypothetical protein
VNRFQYQPQQMVAEPLASNCTVIFLVVNNRRNIINNGNVAVAELVAAPSEMV